MKHYPTFKAIWGLEEYNNYSKIEEENENYYVEKQHDKIFRMLLDDKKDVVKFINKILNQKFKEEEIEKYNSSFVNNMFRNQEADVVYKIKDKNIFILIEHQTKIDYSMPYRILQYEIAIIKSALDVKKLKNKSYKLPLVIPVVLYIGKKKWNANKYLEESQETLEGVKSSLSYYNIVDVNDFTEKELLEDGIIAMIFKHKIGKENANELINKIRGGNEEMSGVIEMIKKENQMYVNMGRKEGKKETQVKLIKNMLKEKLSIEVICRVTGLDKNKIEKIKDKE